MRNHGGFTKIRGGGMVFKTIKENYRQLFDDKVNEALKEGFMMLGEPKALLESYKEDDKVYKQIVFVAFMEKKE